MPRRVETLLPDAKFCSNLAVNFHDAIYLPYCTIITTTTITTSNLDCDFVYLFICLICWAVCQQWRWKFALFFLTLIQLSLCREPCKISGGDSNHGVLLWQALISELWEMTGFCCLQLTALANTNTGKLQAERGYVVKMVNRWSTSQLIRHNWCYCIKGSDTRQFGVKHTEL